MDTRDEAVGATLFNTAKTLVIRRYPEGEGGAAAIRTATGRILTSISPDVCNDALSLCMEVGACLEACKLDEAVTHSLCLYRSGPDSPFIILTACGICQERLRFWGDQVRVAISRPDNSVKFMALRDLSPHHWSQVNGPEKT